MRIVFDTNIFISAILGGSVGVIINQWRDGKFTLVVSEAIVREYLDVIYRPKFKISAEEISATTDYLLKTAEFVTPLKELIAVEADPSDDKFLETALQGEADYVVSGDNHLLELKTFRGIPILTAREFIKLL